MNFTGMGFGMLLLAYSSTAAGRFEDGDLIGLLINSRAANRRLGLTGILLFSSGRFFQVLEGPNDVVAAKYDTIASDPRHENMTLVWREEETERQFPKWTMGFKELTSPMIAQIPGYDSFFTLEPKPSRSAVYTLLERFRNDESLEL